MIPGITAQHWYRPPPPPPEQAIELPFIASTAVAHAPTFAEDTGDTDASFSSVALLLGADGSDTSTTFTDESPAGHTLTANGNVQITTTDPKFESGAALFDGSGDYITSSVTSAYDLSGGVFTIEAWVKPDIADTWCIVSLWGGSGNCWALYQSGAGKLTWAWVTAGGTSPSLAYPSSGSWSPNTSDYQHISVCRNAGGDIRMRIDGELVASVNHANPPRYFSGSILTIGRLAGTFDFDGRMDELRITNGVCRYDTSDATIAVPTAAFPRS